MPTYPDATSLPGGLSATAVTELWTFGPTDTEDGGSDDWNNKAGPTGTTFTVNGLDIVVQSSNMTACGPDGSTGIRVNGSGGGQLCALKIDLDDAATLGGYTRQPGDLWLIDVCYAVVGGTPLLRNHSRDLAGAGGELVGIKESSATAWQLYPAAAGTGAHTMTVRRIQLRIANYTGTTQDVGHVLVQDSATPSQDIDDLLRVSPDLANTHDDVVWLRMDVGASDDATITNIGIGVVPGVGHTPGALSWDYAP
jgi:hypothetical protein